MIVIAGLMALGLLGRPDTVQVADRIEQLERYIIGRLDSAKTPGLAVVLMVDGRIAYRRGFGVANSITRSRVTPATVFPVASLGKPIVAYATLRLADQGRIALDAPLRAQMKHEWSSESDAIERITPRQLLTHTSGLGNFLGDKLRATRFSPGDSFAYSGVGYMYLQAGLEDITGEALDSITTREVMGPLGMAHTWFGRRARAKTGLGHVPADRVVVPAGLVFIPLAVLLLAIAGIAHRLSRRSWRVPRRAVALVLALALAGTTLFLLRKASYPGAVPIFLLGFAMFAVLGLVLATLLTWRAPKWRAVMALPVYLALFAMARSLTIPLPVPVRAGGNAASSLRSSADDLGTFMQELVLPLLLRPAAAGRDTVYVPVTSHTGWNLVMAEQRGERDTLLFHWGRNPSMRALMVLRPGDRSGIAIIANHGQAGDLIADIAVHALGGERWWATE